MASKLFISLVALFALLVCIQAREVLSVKYRCHNIQCGYAYVKKCDKSCGYACEDDCDEHFGFCRPKVENKACKLCGYAGGYACKYPCKIKCVFGYDVDHHGMCYRTFPPYKSHDDERLCHRKHSCGYDSYAACEKKKCFTPCDDDCDEDAKGVCHKRKHKGEDGGHGGHGKDDGYGK